jgi:hypothetical protein
MSIPNKLAKLSNSFSWCSCADDIKLTFKAYLIYEGVSCSPRPSVPPNAITGLFVKKHY